SVRNSTDTVCDPCCGDGILLEAAYNRLRELGRTHQDTISAISGFECDELLARLAFSRLVLKEPAAIQENQQISIFCENMFDQSDMSSNVILMNPPFMRYERMRWDIPNELKQHYADSISSVKGSPSIAVTGQQNLFVYYVEYVISTVALGCRLGIILDNRWYHNQYGKSLRNFILQNCEIDALVEYPFQNLFADRRIATSILICRKSNEFDPSHKVKFIRIKSDLANLRMQDVNIATSTDEFSDSEISCKTISQSELRADTGWKGYFGNPLSHNYLEHLTPLTDLFDFSRRGSLQKEEGGMSPLGFPWSNQTYGRDASGKSLSTEQNRRLNELAQRIPELFKGFAINNADVPQNYILTVEDVLREPTIELNWHRGRQEFRGRRKTKGILEEQRTLSTLSRNPHIGRFIETFKQYKGLNEMAD
ncbi:MAG: class I SAM-dependent DNA methyltransferase, partial [Candidatus Hodarchaeota archaeon]